MQIHLFAAHRDINRSNRKGDFVRSGPRRQVPRLRSLSTSLPKQLRMNCDILEKMDRAMESDRPTVEYDFMDPARAPLQSTLGLPLTKILKLSPFLNYRSMQPVDDGVAEEGGDQIPRHGCLSEP